MDIYKARELQKQLFKLSNVPFRRMESAIRNDTFYYVNIYHLSKERVMMMDVGMLGRIKYSLDNKVIISFEYVPSTVTERVPVGMYVTEFIPVD